MSLSLTPLQEGSVHNSSLSIYLSPPYDRWLIAVAGIIPINVMLAKQLLCKCRAIAVTLSWCVREEIQYLVAAGPGARTGP